jgi:hypothetical protein
MRDVAADDDVINPGLQQRTAQLLGARIVFGIAANVQVG